MKIYLYTHFQNINQYKKGTLISCRPEPGSAHDIRISLNSDKIHLESNQTGIYIRKRKPIKDIINRLKKTIKNKL